ncbi:polysaccharide deacetylase family protein [Gaetbulibacter aestuarii]|uniref:Polysaccharide deacetylase family protein n=1 Tax=Gaetbulibacter aestuarii TaxID=1502358 RepID=A0ABW7MVA8_9FLAO
MKILPGIIFVLILSVLGCKDGKNNYAEKEPLSINKSETGKPTVSFTFDDGSTQDIAGFPFKEWNQMILTHLEEEDLKAIFFVTGQNKLDENGQFLLESWTKNGHKIANHTFTHPNFNAEKNNANVFEQELKATDTIISKFKNSIKLFRFPYLKEGQNKTKVDSLRNILAAYGYHNGYVTIDTSDWYINQRLINKIRKLGFENTAIEKFRDFYLQHILERANYYEKLSFEINKNHIHHVILLHHNLTSALFLGNLIERFKEEGWDVTDADKAYKDDIFKDIPRTEFAGESLIYSLAKQSGNYNNSLRYPAEDSRYEKDKMDKLGL